MTGPSGMETAGEPVAIDGSEASGSGTLVRFAVALAALFGRPLHMTRARARRKRPGLRPQHLAAVRACAELCGAATKGLAVGAQQFEFTPGSRIRGGSFVWDIGTAGSATMLALSVLPLACFAEEPLVARITGGVFQDFAPSPFHLERVLAPILGRMGVTVELRTLRAGYPPSGAGQIDLRVAPPRAGLSSLVLEEPGAPGEVQGIAFASHLAERRVAERMAQSCEARLAAGGLRSRIERVDDTLAVHPGAALAVWTVSALGARLGADRAGAPRRSSEAIGRFVAEQLIEDVASGAATDRHLADQLVVFAALARGTTSYTIPCRTEHLDANLWLVRRFGVDAACDARRVEIRGVTPRG